MRLLLFDIDGTLLLTNGGGQGALEIALTSEFGVKSPDTDISYSGRTDRSIFDELLERNGLDPTETHRSRLASQYSRLLPEVLNERGGRILPGVSKLLQAVQDHEDLIPYVMTGNLESTATTKLKYFGLTDFFCGVFGGQHDLQRNDLARRTANSLANEYGSNSLDIVVIGDTPADVDCGHAIGAKAIAVCTGSYERPALETTNPLAVCDDLSKVPDIMRLLAK